MNIAQNGASNVGPRAKAEIISARANNVEQIHGLAETGEDTSLRYSASGVRCSGLFRDLIRCPQFPPTEEAELVRLSCLLPDNLRSKQRLPREGMSFAGN